MKKTEVCTRKVEGACLKKGQWTTVSILPETPGGHKNEKIKNTEFYLCASG